MTCVAAIAALMAAGMPSPTLGAAALYVRAVAGADANDGRTPATAVRTIGQAARLAQPGDDVVVGPGTYAEGDIAPVAFGRVRFLADRQGTAVGDPAGDIVVDATGHVAGFVLNGKLAVTIDGFVVYGARIGLYVKSQSDKARVLNNIVTGNTGNGIYVQDSKEVFVFNNLVYRNGGAGILVTGNVAAPVDGAASGSRGAAVVNNTVYANGDRGIFFSGTDVGSPDGLVLGNVVQDSGRVNTDVPGIQVNPTSLHGYVNAGNVTADRYFQGTPVDATDRRGDALFADPAGPDGVAGGPQYFDDDFRVHQTAAGQGDNSPAVDAGAVLAAGLFSETASTRSDGGADEGWADAGYHYANFSSPPVPDPEDLRYLPLYVAAGGSDKNAGDSPDAPLLHLARALTLAHAGNRIFVGPGVYVEGDLKPDVSGIGGRRLIIQGTGDTVIDSTGFENAFVFKRGGFLSVVDLQLHGARVALQAGTDSRLHVRGVQLCGQCTGVNADGADEVVLTESVIGNSGVDGVFATSTGAVSVTNSVLYGGRKGIQLIDVPAPLVQNNLIHGNRGSGIVITSMETGSPGARVLNNTLYGNGNRGLLLGPGGGRPPCGSGEVQRNIFAGNLRGGLQVNQSSLEGYVGDYNLSADDYGPFTPVGEYDVIGDPGLRDPARGDFRLSQLAAGDPVQSLGVDAGGVDAITAGVADRTTRADGEVDADVVDIGFHYPVDGLSLCDEVPVPDCSQTSGSGYCDGDGQATIADLIRGVNLALGDASADDCPAMDLNNDGSIDISELVAAVANALG